MSNEDENVGLFKRSSDEDGNVKGSEGTAAISGSGVISLNDCENVVESVWLGSHSNAINAMVLDHNSSLLVTGSSDYTINFWDLEHMSSEFEPTETLDIFDKQPITSMAFDRSGQKLLVCSGGSRPKLLTRNGTQIIEFMKGDTYLKDLKFTKGHTLEATRG